MEEEVIKIEDILHAIRDRWKLIVIITLSTTLLSAIFSFYVIKPEYQSTTKLFIGKEQTESSSDYSNNDIQMYQKLMKTYSEVIKTKDLVSSALSGQYALVQNPENQEVGVIQSTTIPLEVNQVLKNLTVTTSTDSQILQISYTSTNPEEAANVVKAITNAFMIKSKGLIPNGNVQVIEEAQVPENPVSPNKKLNIAIAFILGLMISIGLVFLLEYLDNSFKDKDTLESALGLPVIGIIPMTNSK